MNHDGVTGGKYPLDDPSLESALAEMLCAMESSDSASAAEVVIARYPQHASELRSCREDMTAIDGLVGEIRQAAHGVPDSPDIPGYRILELKDEGGMGYVFRAHYERLGRVVALKVIRDDRPINTEELRRFHNEARCASDLDHAYIIKVHDNGVECHPPYYSMELVDGHSLKEWLEEFGTFDSQAAAKLMLDLANAMARAHKEKVVHRDLKPGNILIDRDHKPRVIDFGLAKRDNLPDPIKPGTFVGTPFYCSPEQAKEEAHIAGPSADVYSLGAVLYEMLTGQPPLQGANYAETLEKVREQPPLPLTAHKPHISRELETICLCCLQKNPENRYPNAGELANDLERYIKGKPLACPAARNSFWEWVINRGIDEKISKIGPSLLRFQAIYTGCILALQILLLLNWGEPLAWVLAFGSLPLIFAILKTDDSTGWLPGTPAERILWSIWIGVIFAHFVLAIAMRISHGYVAGFHQTYALMPFVTGLAYFIQGGSFWKQNLMWGALWVMLGLVIVTLVAQPWSPLVYIAFSCACTTHLLIAQMRLAQIRRDATDSRLPVGN